MRSWLFPPTAPRRAVEATAAMVNATGAALGSYGVADPIDSDLGYRRSGGHGRPIPEWTVEKARTYSVAAYRANPMARAIIDTYTSFCVGDSGVSPQVTNPEVRAVVDEFWTDPRNRLGSLQEPFLRDHLIMGETALELMQGAQSGAVRFSPISPEGIHDITLLRDNPLWHHEMVIKQVGASDRRLTIAAVDDFSQLRTGEAMFWPSWRALLTDRRGAPFLMPVLDWLDSYDQVLSNLVDRTALARYLVWTVKVEGSQTDVDTWVKNRGGLHAPRSGSIEVHNQSVEWTPQTAQTGAYEDTKAAAGVLTQVAGGSGLAKTWLAEPEDSNRATSLTMAEPVRRRVGGVQRLWLGYQTELVRFAVDRAVAAKRIPRLVKATDPKTGETFQIPAAQAVTVTGPAIAAADATIAAQVLLNLATGLEKLVQQKILTPEAAQAAAAKGWEDFVGVPYIAELGKPDSNRDDLATAIDDAEKKKLHAVN